VADPEYFTLVEFRLLPQMSDDEQYPNARVEAKAAEAVADIEREVGTSFIGREVTERYDGTRGGINLRKRYVLADPAPEATESGVAVTDDLVVDDGILYRFVTGASTPSGWARGRLNVEVTYTAGYSDEPPADIKEAAMQLTRLRLLETDSHAVMDARATQLTNEMGGTTTYAVAGLERPTGYPMIDAKIMSWKRRLNTVTYP